MAMAAGAQVSAIPAISMTTFVDFAQAVGNARITAVRNAKEMYEAEYQPPFDFYKQLREAICEMHRSGASPAVLDRFISTLSNARKDQKYQDCVAAYKKWLGRKTIGWVGASSGTWMSSGLTVRVNPELGISINGQTYAIKLYFKQQAASKQKLDVMLHLLEVALARTGQPFIPAILDVPRGRLIEPTGARSGLAALLAGEAAAFSTMWQAV